MSPKSMERHVQILAAIGVWLPFLVARALAGAQACAAHAQGTALPVPTALALQVAQNGPTLLIPAGCSALLPTLLCKRSAHGPWVAVILMLFSTAYASFGHLAAVLPSQTLCAALRG